MTDYSGKIFLYQSDLKNISLIPDDFIDGVVSISALEHNNKQNFKNCVNEIFRVCKNKALITNTISGSLNNDWYHTPSKGWCYSEKSIKEIYNFSKTVNNNFDEKEKIFNELKQEENELHKNLASFYYKSGNNGMPWGKWNPKYLPVGIITINE